MFQDLINEALETGRPYIKEGEVATYIPVSYTHLAREVLGGLPEKVKVGASGSMIKNVKSVIRCV